MYMIGPTIYAVSISGIQGGASNWSGAGSSKMLSVVLEVLVSLSGDIIWSPVMSDMPSVVSGNSCGGGGHHGGIGGGGGNSEWDRDSAPPMRSIMITIWLPIAASATKKCFFFCMLNNFIMIRSTYISPDTSLADGLLQPSNGLLSLATVHYRWKFPGLISVRPLL